VDIEGENAGNLGPVDMRAEALGEFWDEAPVDIKEEEGITCLQAPAFP
jgi:hypothetical protein